MKSWDRYSVEIRGNGRIEGPCAAAAVAAGSVVDSMDDDILALLVVGVDGLDS